MKKIIIAIAVEGLKANVHSTMYWLTIVDYKKLEEMKNQDFDMERFLKAAKGIDSTHLYSLGAKYAEWREKHKEYTEIELYFDLQKDSLYDRWEKDERMIARIRSFSKIEVHNFMDSIFDLFKV